MMHFHPLAEIFPILRGVHFDDLAEDIAVNGLHESIVTYEGKILDGRNRYLACLRAKVEPRFKEYTGADPLGYVVSLNLRRRHLDESQRGMVHARIATLRRGANQHTAIAVCSQEEASKLLNVSVDTGQRARKVLDTGADELIAAVDQGRISVSAAADIAQAPKEQQREIVARGDKEILEAAKEIRAAKSERKRTEKVAATERLRERNAELPSSERKYSVIYADPPWSFEVWSGEGKDRAAENHYPTMSQSEIEELPVASLAADDCALFMWVVMPQLPEALAVIEAWGFKYKTCAFVWIKQTKDEERLATGMGYWTRANSEMCLLATKGSPTRLNADVHQVILSPRLEHSRKPDEVAARIMRLVPGPYIELFARRRPRDGWAVWGNQAGEGAE